MQCGKHVGKNLPVFTCMENPNDVSTSKVYSVRIFHVWRERTWEFERGAIRSFMVLLLLLKRGHTVIGVFTLNLFQ